MALGGGTFTNQNKVLPGSYINFVSLAKASAAVSDRGIACIPMELNWGMEGMTELERGDFLTDSLSIFGYSYTADEMKNIREVFCNAKKLILAQTRLIRRRLKRLRNLKTTILSFSTNRQSLLRRQPFL